LALFGILGIHHLTFGIEHLAFSQHLALTEISHGLQEGPERQGLRMHVPVLRPSRRLLRLPAIPPGQETTARLLFPAGG
jgi:hypothetical protein